MTRRNQLGRNLTEPFPPARAHLGTTHALVVDDATSRATTMMLLHRLGYVADFAVNGADAETIQRDGGIYAAIPMDARMPILNGHAATSSIRVRDAARQGVPSVALTSDGSAKDRTTCLAAGMDGYLATRVEPEVRRAVLLRVVPPLDSSPAADAHRGLSARNVG